MLAEREERIVILEKNWHAEVFESEVVRQLDGEGKEIGPYLVVKVTRINGDGNHPLYYEKKVYAYEINNGGDEPVLTNNVIEINLGQTLKVIGVFELPDENKDCSNKCK